MSPSGDALQVLQSRAVAAFEAGRLREARQLFEDLVAEQPHRIGPRLQLALVTKFLRDWRASLTAALEALRRGDGRDAAAHWTAGIAATALGDWAQARAHWQACGITLAPGTGPVEENFGPIALRLNPWANAETVFAHRIDPARARIANVPLPDSGHRYRDVVLHDGAQVGSRHWHKQSVPVFNELQRLQASTFATFTVFAVVAGDADVEELQRLRVPGVGQVDDWTPSLGQRCMRCVQGIAHQHRWHELGAHGWNPDRTLGVAAESETAVRELLAAWQAGAPAQRQVEAIQAREMRAPQPQGQLPWWQPAKKPR